MIGGCEETTTGIIRLMAMAQKEELEFPMVMVNNADCKHLFDNRYGTGQSVWDGINRTTNLIVAQKVLDDGGFLGVKQGYNVEVNVQFIGRFNASNLLAVYGAACLLGKKTEEVLLALSTLRHVAGRFDSLRSPKGYTAIVDYAHTPDALENVLNAIHEGPEWQR